MARTYKRDKNGKFASGSGGGGSLATTKTRQKAVRQRGNIMAGGSQKKQREYTAGSSMEKTSRTLRRSEMQRAGLGDKSYAGKVSTTRKGNSVSPTKSASAGASSRGKSLRQEGGGANPTRKMLTGDRVYRDVRGKATRVKDSVSGTRRQIQSQSARMIRGAAGTTRTGNRRTGNINTVGKAISRRRKK